MLGSFPCISLFNEIIVYGDSSGLLLHHSEPSAMMSALDDMGHTYSTTEVLGHQVGHTARSDATATRPCYGPYGYVLYGNR